MPSPTLRVGLLAAALALGGTLTPVQAGASEVAVFAASSLTTALEEVAALWQQKTGNKALIVPASSAALARQIAQGAPADVYISASIVWMDYLEDAALIRVETRRDILSNSLVLIAHGADATPVLLSPELDVPALLGDDYLAMGLVEAVPAGVYGKAALISLGLWDDLAGRIAQTDTVRAALAHVATGNAPFGIVYATDAQADPRVSVVAAFPATSHPPITYPAAVVASSTAPEAEAFLGYISGPDAGAVFSRHGFGLVG